MGRKKIFDESAYLNNATFRQYYDRLRELSISMFEWKNLPETVNYRYLETALFYDGIAVYFNDDVIGNLALSATPQGNFDVYGYPSRIRAYSKYNNYQKDLSLDNCVVIYNNLLRLGSQRDVFMFSLRLYNIDRIIDVNVNAQKTPILVQGTDKQRLTLLNLYKEYDGNAPFIFGDKNLDLNALKVLQTGAPYISDKLQELKSQIWNEALTYLGISNVQVQKKERLLSDEVMRLQGGTIASRYSRLCMRQEAAEKINEMFGTDISVEYREDAASLEGIPEEGDGEDE